MHSVLKQKPAPLGPERQAPPSLDMRAYKAAMEHLLAVKDSPPVMATYSRQASARRISAERKESGAAAVRPAAVSRRLFSPATDSTGYRKKHGKIVAPANMIS